MFVRHCIGSKLQVWLLVQSSLNIFVAIQVCQKAINFKVRHMLTYDQTVKLITTNKSISNNFSFIQRRLNCLRRSMTFYSWEILVYAFVHKQLWGDIAITRINICLKIIIYYHRCIIISINHEKVYKIALLFILPNNCSIAKF